MAIVDPRYSEKSVTIEVVQINEIFGLVSLYSLNGEQFNFHLNFKIHEYHSIGLLD